MVLLQKVCRNRYSSRIRKTDFNGSSRAGTECRCGRKHRKYCGGADSGKCSAEYAEGIDAADVLKNTQADTAADFKNVQGQTDTLEQILDQNGLDHLKRLLQNIPTLTGNTDLFEVQEEEDVFVDTMSGDDAGKKAFELARQNRK